MQVMYKLSGTLVLEPFLISQQYGAMDLFGWHIENLVSWKKVGLWMWGGCGQGRSKSFFLPFDFAEFDRMRHVWSTWYFIVVIIVVVIVLLLFIIIVIIIYAHWCSF